MANETNDLLRWNLGDLYASAEDLHLASDLTSAGAMAEAFAARYRGRVAMLSAAELAEALQQFEQLVDRAYRPSLYASLLFSGQTSDEKAQALLNLAQQTTTESFNQVTFFDVELKKLPEDLFAKLLQAPELEIYRHHLSGLRRFAPYTLSEAEEKLSETKNLTGRVAFTQLYDEVSGRIKIPIELNGKLEQVNVATARALRTSSDRQLRRRATDALMKGFEDQSHVLNYCFNTLFQDHALDVNQRGYGNVAEPTFLTDELAPEVVENLMATTERHYPLAQRYMKLKAKALGLTDFGSHDVLAPLATEERKVPFEQARKWVLEAFGAFHPLFASIADEFFEKRWIDALPRQGKRDGAFCSGMLPSLHPYVLLNYADRLEDVSTLAHELGHGIHFYLARRNTPLNFWSTTPMAETASVFAELLLMRQLAAGESDKLTRRNLLAMRIEDILATVFNQVAYTRWEQQAHARRALGVVPPEDYSALWMDQRKRLYGDAVAFQPQDRWGWISIPHFIHSRFYCYSYSFGQLLVLALFRKFEQEGPAFIPKYIELLSSGSSKTPQQLAAGVGIDLTDPGFWGQGFETLSTLIDQFEALL